MKKKFFSLLVLLGAPLFGAASHVELGSTEDIIRAIDKIRRAPIVILPGAKAGYDQNDDVEKLLDQIKNLFIAPDPREAALKLFEEAIQRYGDNDYNRANLDLGRVNNGGFGIKNILETIA